MSLNSTNGRDATLARPNGGLSDLSDFGSNPPSFAVHIAFVSAPSSNFLSAATKQSTMNIGTALDFLRNVSDELLSTHQETTMSTIRQVESRIQGIRASRNPTTSATTSEERNSAQDGNAAGGMLVQSSRTPASGLKRKVNNEQPEPHKQPPSKRKQRSKKISEHISRAPGVYISSLDNLTWIWELIERNPREVIRSHRNLELPSVLLRDIQKTERISNPTKEDKIFRVAALRSLAFRFSIFAEGFARRKKTKRDGIVPRFVREFFQAQDDSTVKKYAQYVRSGQKQLRTEDIFRQELNQRDTECAKSPHAGTGISIFTAFPITLFKNLPMKEIQCFVKQFFLDDDKIMLLLPRPSTNLEPPIEQPFSILEVLERVSKWLVEFQVCYDEYIKAALCQDRYNENIVSSDLLTKSMAIPHTSVAGSNQHSDHSAPFTCSVTAADFVTPNTENTESRHEAVHSSSGQSLSDRIPRVESSERNEWLHKRKTRPAENTHRESPFLASLSVDTFHNRDYTPSCLSLYQSNNRVASIMGLNPEELLTEAADQDAFNPREFSQPYLSLDKSTAESVPIMGLGSDTLLAQATEPQDAFNPRQYSQPYLSLDRSQSVINPRDFSQPYLSLDGSQSVFNPREFSQPYLSLDESTAENASIMDLNSEALLTQAADGDAFNPRQFSQPYISLDSHTVQRFPRSQLPYSALPENAPAVEPPSSHDQQHISSRDSMVHDSSYSIVLNNVGLRQVEVHS